MQENRLKDLAETVLTEINKTTRPASEVLNTFTRTHRFLGAKDRRFLTETVWRVLRQKARLAYCYPSASLREQIDLSERPVPMSDDTPKDVRWEVPAWIPAHINQPETELPALLETPPIVLRANGRREEIRQKLKEEGIETAPTALSPYGLILQKRVNLNNSLCYRQGLVEVQDEGSQLSAMQAGVQAGDYVLDYCAGAGGKSLIFAQLMQNNGRILAHDVSARSLKELSKRATRAGVSIIETTTNLPAWQKMHPSVQWTHVVVDAPCSGTGTWRRCPDARWKLTEEQVKALCRKQAQILSKASTYVAPNGRLVYITCSLLIDENSKQIQHFLKKNTAFKLCSHKQFSPARTRTDGFFCAVMQRVR